MSNLIFLDVDGPVISSGCYGVAPDASIRRACMNTSAIGYLNLLCDQAKAKIVTNSSHNYHEVKNDDGNGGVRNLRDDLIKWGVKEHFFHNDWRTTYSNFDRDNRLHSINEWLAKNGDFLWVCFDDAIFTEDKRLIPIDFDHGITLDAVRRACEVFGINPLRLNW